MVRIERDTLPEGVWPTFADRLVDAKGTVLAQADFSGTLTMLIYDQQGTSPSTVVHTQSSIAIASTVFNALQTDGYWKNKDAKGYNFRYTFDLSNLAAGTTLEGGHTYRFEFQGTTTSVGPVRWKYEITIADAEGD